MAGYIRHLHCHMATKHHPAREKRARNAAFVRAVRRKQKENEELKIRLEGMTKDITALERTEYELEEQARLLDLMHEAVIVHDLASGSISFWNPAAETIYGYPKEEALGKSAHRLLGARFPKPVKAIRAEVLEKGGWQGELIHRRKDGATHTREPAVDATTR